MKIVTVSFILNIHQVYVADALNEITDGQYWFVETSPVYTSEDRKGGELDFSKRPYLIQATRDSASMEEAMRVIDEADVVILGAAPLRYIADRVRKGKITFINSERWLKKGLLNLLSPNLIKQQFFYHTNCHSKPVYALCSSAYASKDFYLLHSFKGKCFKWGYFTEVRNLDMDLILATKRSCPVKILWVARFIHWKHPEKMIELAIKLREQGIDFSIDMIGEGIMRESIQKQIESKGLSNCVFLLGNLSNSRVVEAMKNHHIFCLTSDRNEGWGAVLNEAMGNGCCPVSSIAAGSTSYLIKNGINGMFFDLKKRDDLTEKVLWLIQHPKERECMSKEAYNTIYNTWSPCKAANYLYKLCYSLLNGEICDILEGPCSKA